MDLKHSEKMSMSPIDSTPTCTPQASLSSPVEHATSDATPSHGTDRLNCRGCLPWLAKVLPRPHFRKVILACAIVVLPMMAFTIAIVWVVFANSLGQASCPYTELCPGPELLNATTKGHYYVDFSAGRLAFISSLSATISFALVNLLMMMYAYTTAHQMLYSSEDDAGRATLPSPYQMSHLIRVLNAELLLLCELSWNKLKGIFWELEGSDYVKSKQRSPRTLRRSIAVFLVCLMASILIQLADTYLHISIKSSTFIQIEPETAHQHYYSRTLAPWCYNRQGAGTINNKNFWGCSVNYAEKTAMAALANNTAVNSYTLGPMKDYALSYVDSDGVQYSLVGPPNAPQDTDWKATSFGASTQCSAMPAGACDVSSNVKAQTFNCTKARSGVDLSGNLTGYTVQEHYFDIHKHLYDASAFDNFDIIGWDDVNRTAPEVTDSEVDSIFNNPWHWMSVVAIPADEETLPDAFKNDPRIWPKYDGGLDHMWLLCNTTVLDIGYTAVGHKVTSIESKKSNGTMAGITSMTLFRALGFFASEFSQALVAAATAPTPDEFIKTYAREVSRIMTHPLAAQTIEAPATLVQTRSSKIVTELPISALWILVTANMLFAALGIALAVMALLFASETVHQIHTRLGITGLVAALFEQSHSERAVRSETDLFEEKSTVRGRTVKKVGVKRTNTGGSAFTLTEVRE